MADKLSIFNGALAYLKERRLSSLEEEIETRYVLDDIWASGNIPDFLLEEADWAFARKSVKLEAVNDREAAFGYRNIFQIGEDVARITSISSDEYYHRPLVSYQLDGNQIVSDYIDIYIRYVSYERGRDLGNWTRSFADLAERYLAYRAAGRLGEISGAEMAAYERSYEKALNNAIAHTSVAEPTQFLPAGRWRQARVSSRFDSGDNRHGRT